MDDPFPFPSPPGERVGVRGNFKYLWIDLKKVFEEGFKGYEKANEGRDVGKY